MLCILEFLLAVQVGFEYPSYLVAEDSGNVSVCVTATGQLAREVTVTLSTSDETAMGKFVHYSQDKKLSTYCYMYNCSFSPR